MRICFQFALTLAMAGSGIFAGAARADDLTGKMAPYNYLTAKPWSCTTSVPAMGDQPARTDQSTATFDATPRNTMHTHIQSSVYAGDSYYGYSERTNSYWQTSSDNVGVHSFLTSTDGKTYTGTSSIGPMSAQDTTTYAKVAPNKVTVHEVISGGPMSGTFDSVCTQ